MSFSRRGIHGFGMEGLLSMDDDALDVDGKKFFLMVKKVTNIGLYLMQNTWGRERLDSNSSYADYVKDSTNICLDVQRHLDEILEAAPSLSLDEGNKMLKRIVAKPQEGVLQLAAE